MRELARCWVASTYSQPVQAIDMFHWARPGMACPNPPRDLKFIPYTARSNACLEAESSCLALGQTVPNHPCKGSQAAHDDAVAARCARTCHSLRVSSIAISIHVPACRCQTGGVW